MQSHLKGKTGVTVTGLLLPLACWKADALKCCSTLKSSAANNSTVTGSVVFQDSHYSHRGFASEKTFQAMPYFRSETQIAQGHAYIIYEY